MNEPKEIKKILYIDDSLENGRAAMVVDSRIHHILSLSSLETSFGDYDCIITDMQMETPTSGFEVVRAAAKEGKLPHIVTGGTYDHGGLFDRVTIFDHNYRMLFNKFSKKDPGFWSQAIPYMAQNELEDPTRVALQLCFSILREIPGDSLEMVLQFYQSNYGGQ